MRCSASNLCSLSTHTSTIRLCAIGIPRPSSDKVKSYKIFRRSISEKLKFLFLLLVMNNSALFSPFFFFFFLVSWENQFRIGYVLGPGKFQLDDVQSALSLCTHLIYGFAGINAETFEVVPLKPSLDTGVGYSYYKLVTQLKRSFPNLKIYLSIGGNADPDDETHKYLVLVSILYTLFSKRDSNVKVTFLSFIAEMDIFFFII